MFRALHPQDDRLFDCYLSSRHGDALDPLLAEHLADCATCASRYAELGSATRDAIARYVADVKSRRFPSDAESY